MKTPFDPVSPRAVCCAPVCSVQVPQNNSMIYAFHQWWARIFIGRFFEIQDWMELKIKRRKEKIIEWIKNFRETIDHGPRTTDDGLPDK